MARSPRRSSPSQPRLLTLELSAAALSLLALCAWTWLVLTGHTAALDARLHAPGLPLRSVRGQLAEAFSLLTHPLLVLLAVLAVAVFSYARRMRRLAIALVVAAVGAPAAVALSAWLGVERPSTAFADSVSNLGGAYPSSHVAAVTIGAWVTVTLVRAHRRPGSSVLAWSLLVGCLALLTAVAQWATGLAHGSDVIGGALLGVAVANLALLAGGVRPILVDWARLGLPAEQVDAHAAVILNPTKFDDLSLLRRRVEATVLERGWRPTTWLETSTQDPGHEAARRALADGADLVLVAGGDGTVRAVSAELAGTGVPMALLPSGTGNLLARNLGVPLDTDSALDLAFRGRTRPIDVVAVTWLDGEGATRSERFAVMAGLGLDAQIMEDTNDELKKVIRSGAYAVAAVQNAVPDPFHVTITLDEGDSEARSAVMVLMGNVGTITGRMTIFPEARPDDGLLDLMVASPDRVTDWARLGTQILTGRDSEGFRTTSAARVLIETDDPVPFELDGDTVGSARRVEAVTEPGALTVVVPR
ncbi:bifunctional phosphatase PAP2/diacylglycerol kinase family protein [Actinomyces sp. W5033]|uniref:bifunctional phosphatase PAP2/diacylglycerol kinase family protein n=1 Tax=Actinomyces sp. W5033 TaxID=3446479 RepID=UPI003EE3CB8A